MADVVKAEKGSWFRAAGYAGPCGGSRHPVLCSEARCESSQQLVIAVNDDDEACGRGEGTDSLGQMG